MMLSFKYRLYPTRAQTTALDGMLSALCDLYNAALQQRIEAYRRRGRTLRYADQAAELKAARAADARLAGLSFSTEQQVLRRLDKAFRAFFRRLKAGGKPGFPRFKGRDRFHAAEFRVGDGLTLKTERGRIGLVGIPGEIKARWHRPLPGKPKAAILTRQAGRWHVVFQVEVETAAPGSHRSNSDAVRSVVGIDAGLHSLVALSTGEAVPAPPFEREAAKGLRRRQRALARCRPRSGVRARRKLALARYKAKVAARRRDFLHKLTAGLTRRFGVLVFEDLNVAGMIGAANHRSVRQRRCRTAKAILNAAWGTLRGFADYKASRAGGRCVAVDPRGTSQECECGAPVPKILKDRLHVCPGCGAVEDRDVMAGKVIRKRYLLRHGTCLAAPSAGSDASRVVA